MPSRLRRSQMPRDESSRVNSATFYLPLTSAGEAAPRPPYGSHSPQAHPPLHLFHLLACLSTFHALPTAWRPRYRAAPHPHAATLRLRVHVVRVDVARARTLPSSAPLAAQVMWTACGLKDRCCLGMARPTTGLPVLPRPARLNACGHRLGHAAVGELSSSRVFGVSLTL